MKQIIRPLGTGQLETIQIVRLSGKASIIFPLFALWVKQQGNRTLGELIKNLKGGQ